jgi:hypothetical protein
VQRLGCIGLVFKAVSVDFGRLEDLRRQKTHSGSAILEAERLRASNRRRGALWTLP